MIKIESIEAFTDNYIWLVTTNEGSIVIDPGESSNIINLVHKNQLDLNARYINIEYNSKLVENFCPKQSVGCYTSADRGRIIVRDDISKPHHDVVIFGLYSDYIQHTNTGLIDSSLTCDLKVNYLKDIKKNNLANLYSGQCDAIYKNKILVMN